ncbi:hypothetical protein HHL17_09925 [Chitinophaga sp. G-6-1-13]|uniref:DUF3592 domain-containing protein n=1 Tax=Chitinophaga fulva TaxID=2728842 RepID=A0A848GI54_9BACT|nr:hypothetical protein [Chitinophaga fulva]NML37507.1 hypothetical protein [Chitinophaga fulva]
MPNLWSTTSFSNSIGNLLLIKRKQEALLKRIHKLKNYQKAGMMVFVLAVLFFGFWMGNRRANRLYEDGYWTTGVIVERGTDYKGRLAFNYEFYVDGKKYHHQASGVGIRPESYQEFIGKSLPVLYNSKDPSENDMLLRPNDFSSHGRELPDSLFWILDCVEK